jgi:hypothetical protein
VAPQLLGGNRRAATASARGPWPCSLGSSRWADKAVWETVLRHGYGLHVSCSRRHRKTHPRRVRRSAATLRHDVACTLSAFNAGTLAKEWPCIFCRRSSARRRDVRVWLYRHDSKSKEAWAYRQAKLFGTKALCACSTTREPCKCRGAQSSHPSVTCHFFGTRPCWPGHRSRSLICRSNAVSTTR